MSTEHIDHSHIVNFADKTVNLPREHAKKYREQVGRLSDELKNYVNKNPEFKLRKILLSGSLAKHTALRNINDADVAVYVKSAPEDVGKLMPWLVENLRTAFPNFRSDQVEVQTYSVRVDFRGTGLSVDVVPVYAENEDWGYLVSQHDGTKLKTNITLHKDFIQKRNEKNTHYRQVVRLLKWWVRTRKEDNNHFGFKSFMIELVLAKLVDDGVNLDNYPEALSSFFDYIAKTNFSEMIVFRDYVAATPQQCDNPIRVFDPVNEKNNVGRKYTQDDRNVIVNECIDAGDTIAAALRAPTKTETLKYWQKIFGPSFSE
ncbi:MAG: CBASS oligonucleotide cyclase [Gammaproteobacteria bacterium WSBS_2016_MAG_OTU1]